MGKKCIKNYVLELYSTYRSFLPAVELLSSRTDTSMEKQISLNKTLYTYVIPRLLVGMILTYVVRVWRIFFRLPNILPSVRRVVRVPFRLPPVLPL